MEKAQDHRDSGTWNIRDATPAELASCLKAIAEAHPGAIPQDAKPEVHVAGSETKESFYVTAHPLKDLPPGTVYRTWIVDFSAGANPTVTWFRSRRGDKADDSTPLGDRNEDTLPLVAVEDDTNPAEGEAEETTSPGGDDEDTPS